MKDDDKVKNNLQLISDRTAIVEKLIADKAKMSAAERKSQEKAEKEEAARIAALDIIMKDDIFVLNVGRNTVFYGLQGKKRVPMYKETLLGHYALLFEDLPMPKFMHVLDVCDRCVHTLTNDWTTKSSGFKNGTGTFNLMEKNFCEPSDSDDVHWFIDFVLANITDDDGIEGFEAVERTLYAKWLTPENMLLPSINFINHDGNAGKSLYIENFIATLFGADVPANQSGNFSSRKIKQLTGRFNSTVAGKAIIFINESFYDPADNDALKDIIGSRSISIELKGKEAFNAPLTALLIFATNKEGGAVMLAGNKVDRRYSLFGTSKNIDAETLKALIERKILPSDAVENDAGNWIKEIGQTILHDPKEVGKWITRSAGKYGMKGFKVEAFHGVTYDACSEAQEPAWFNTVREVLNNPKFTFIDVNYLVQIVRTNHEHDLRNKNDSTIAKQLKPLIKKMDDFVVEDGAKIYIHSSDISERRSRNIIKKSGFILHNTKTLALAVAPFGNLDISGGFKPNKM